MSDPTETVRRGIDAQGTPFDEHHMREAHAALAELTQRLSETEREREALERWKEERIATRPKLSRRDLNTRNKELRESLRTAEQRATEATDLLREWFAPFARDMERGLIEGTDFAQRVASFLHGTDYVSFARRLRTAEERAEQAERERDEWKDSAEVLEARAERAEERVTRLEAALREARCPRCGEWVRDMPDVQRRSPTEGERRCYVCGAREGEVHNEADHKHGNSGPPWFLTSTTEGER